MIIDSDKIAQEAFNESVGYFNNLTSNFDYIVQRWQCLSSPSKQNSSKNDPTKTAWQIASNITSMNEIASLMQLFMANYNNLDEAFWQKYNEYYDYLIGVY